MISIIIPVYNISDYLDRCISSVLKQSYKNLEIILVDDGSTDNSGEICDNYKKEDKRIKVIHKENGGVSSARNTGLENANGEYVAFIDGDDYIEEDYFKILIDNIKKYNCDISCCNLVTVETNGKRNKEFNASKIYDAKYIIENYFFNNFIKTIMYGPYNKLYKREIIGNIRFKNYKYAEDVLFVFEVLMNTKKVYYDQYDGYYYMHRENSAMKSNFTMNKFDYVDAAREIKSICLLNNLNIIEDVCKWEYHHTLVTIRQALLNRNKVDNMERINNEKRILRKNKKYLKGEKIIRKIDYYIIQYIDFLFDWIGKFQKRKERN